MSTAPLGDTLNLYLDTLHTDYAFIIALQPVLRNMQVDASVDSSTTNQEWTFSLFPNPTSNLLNLAFPDDTPIKIDILDLSGRKLRSWIDVTGPLVRLPISHIASGAYFIRATSGEKSQVKPLIIR